MGSSTNGIRGTNQVGFPGLSSDSSNFLESSILRFNPLLLLSILKL